MKNLRKWMWTVLLLSLATFSGCMAAAIVGPAAVAGVAFGDNPSFAGTDSLEFEKAYTDILDVIAETGKSLGYRVSGLDREGRSIQLTTKSTIVDKALFSGFQTNPIALSFQVSEDGKKLKIMYSAGGKKGGTPEKAKGVLEEFKKKLSENLKQN